jgi:GT2 family glycosyltransferase
VNQTSDQDQRNTRLAQLERRVKQLEYNQRILNSHVAALERSIVFRILQRVGRPLLDLKTRAVRWLANSPLRSLTAELQDIPDPYLLPAERAQGEPPALASAVTFCILLPVDEPRRDWLEQTINSVRSQSHPFWELWICPPLAPETWLTDYLAALSSAEKRIHVVPAKEPLRMVGTLNDVAGSSAADYLVLIDCADKMEQDALLWIAASAPAAIIYTDEDHLDKDGRRCRPVFKPDWSPDLLLSCMYMGQLLAVSREAWELAGRFDPKYGDLLAYDLVLRMTDQPVTVRRVPRILHHRRIRPSRKTVGQIADIPPAGRMLLKETIIRRGLHGEVEDGPGMNSFRIRWQPSKRVLSSIIVCSRSPSLLKRCLSALAARTQYSEREVIVVQHCSKNDAAMKTIIDRFGAKQVAYSGPFHFSRMNNVGVKVAAGEILVFLNDDVEPLDASWLERLVAQVQRSDVGAAGARLLYPSGTLQHAGVTIAIGDGCGHIGRGSFESPYWPWLNMTRDVAAVTGACLVIRRALFDSLHGFSERFPVNYNDVDLCLRVREAGYRVILESASILRHYECQSRRGGVSAPERELWYELWSDTINAGDPFYSPHLTCEREDLSLRGPSE